MSRFLRLFYLFLIVSSSAVLAASFYERHIVEQAFAEEAERAAEQAEQQRRQVILFREGVLPRGRAFAQVLTDEGLGAATVSSVVRESRPVYDLARVRAGNRFAIGRSLEGEFRALRYQVDDDRQLWVLADDEGGLRAEIRDIPSTTEVVGVAGELTASLFEAVMDAGEGPELALELAGIFGWDLDFYTDPRRGDTFRVIVEKKTYLNGQRPRYGRVLAAEYNNEGRVYQAVLFRDPEGRAAYYAADGKSLQKAFLRSPLKFGGRISSRFSLSRFHPILKRHRPHLGIDYAAPTGTPVQAIGDGRVVSAGWNGGSGRMVHLRHNNGYETFYLHLSRIFVAAGQRVSQGQQIGLVGSTGLATGPHLDFRIRQHGQYRNFERLRLPPAQPVAKADWDEFVATRERWLPQLNALQPGRPGTAPTATTADDTD